jgi:serine/threonine-protein phosphatase 4 catalytic subunit
LKIVGGIRGQFYDLLEVFLMGGELPDTTYLFLGNFIGRGSHHLNTLTLLFLFKIKYPKQILLLRGLNECRQMTQQYGLYDEIYKEYGTLSVWRIMCKLFDCLPLCALIDDRIFCAAGGPSPSMYTDSNTFAIEKITEVDRFAEIPHERLIIDLLTTEAEEIDGWGLGRNSSYQYGEEIVDLFHASNNTDLIIRSSFTMDGFQYMFNNKLLNIFSAPNFVARCNNLGAIVEIENNERTLLTWKGAPQQY